MVLAILSADTIVFCVILLLSCVIIGGLNVAGRPITGLERVYDGYIIRVKRVYLRPKLGLKGGAGFLVGLGGVGVHGAWSLFVWTGRELVLFL